MTACPRPGELWRWRGSASANGPSIPDHNVVNVVLEIVRSEDDPELAPHRGFVYALLLELESGKVIKSWSIMKPDDLAAVRWERIL